MIKALHTGYISYRRCKLMSLIYTILILGSLIAVFQYQLTPIGNMTIGMHSLNMITSQLLTVLNIKMWN